MDKKIIKKIAIILGVLLLPLIYSITYLKGFWDPYNNLNNMKIAVVNNDECTKNCQSTELIKKLKDSDSFSFVVKSSKEAEKGLLDKKYYATITIPKDFTESFEKADTKNRSVPTISYRANKKTNYIAAQLIENALIRLEKEMDKEISKEVVSKLSDKLIDVPNQTNKISEALGTIYSGSVALNNGAIKLSDGSKTLNNNYSKFDSGVDELNSGIEKTNEGINSLNNNSSKIKTGINTINNSVNSLNEGTDNLNNKYNEFDNGVNQLNTALNQLKDNTSKLDILKSAIGELVSGSNRLKTGLTDYKTNSDKAYNDAENVYNIIVNYIDSNPDLKNNPNLLNAYMIAKAYTTVDGEGNALAKLRNGLNQINNGSNTLNAGLNGLNNNLGSLDELVNAINSLADGSNELANNSNLIKDGINQLNEGTNKLKNGVNGLNQNYTVFDNGINQINAASNSIKEGSQSLSNASSLIYGGINTLEKGTNQLQSGTKTFNEGVNQAKSSVDKANQESKEKLKDLDGLDEYTQTPVKFNDKSYGKVDDYGTFFSPFFMSLSLWLGGILIIVGLYYDPEKRFSILGKNSTNRLKRLGYYELIGIAQSIILPLILVLTLGFKVTSWPLFFGSCVLIGLSFLALMLFLVFNFDDVGKFLAIVLLVVQLAACAGTFPLETEPTFFSNISPFMPMTYSVELLRESFVSIDKSILIKDVGVLSGIFIVFSALIIITGILKTKRQNKKV